jgi:hypothetical protein
MNTQSRAVGAIARGGFGILILAAGFVACAGGDTPPVDSDLRTGLAANYGGAAGSQMGSAGASGSGGSGTGNGGTGNGGSSNAAGGAAGSSASGGSGPGGGSGPDLGNACDAYTTIFLVQCAGSSCHGDGSDNGVFAGSQAPAPGELVNVTSENGEACGVLVDPDNIEDSVLLQMLTAEPDQNQACSPVPMPLAGEDLDEAELECVTEYLTALASN